LVGKRQGSATEIAEALGGNGVWFAEARATEHDNTGKREGTSSAADPDMDLVIRSGFAGSGSGNFTTDLDPDLALIIHRYPVVVNENLFLTILLKNLSF
jgi:hypothetical protein